MMTRFGTYEEACIFAAFKQSEGYFAVVLHENMGHMWGPVVTQGFPVIVSNELIPAGADTEAGHPLPPIIGLPGWVLGLYGGVLAILMLSYELMVSVMGQVMSNPVRWFEDLFFLLALSVGLLYVLYFFLHLTRIYRRPDARLHGMSRLVIDSLLWLLVLI